MNVLDRLLGLAAEHPERLHEAIIGTGVASRERADEAAHRAFEALSRQDTRAAQAAFTVASLMFMEVGDWPGYVGTGIFRANALKYHAETLEQYEVAQSLAQVHMHLARRLRIEKLMFFGAVVAADCAYFAAEIAEGAERRHWLLAAMGDCLTAAGQLEAADSSAPFYVTSAAETLASLSQALVRAVAETTGWTDEQRGEADTFRRRITLAFESAEPPAHPGVAMALARMSYDTGSPDVGYQRLSALADEAVREGDVQAFAMCAEQLYQGERTSSRPSGRMRELRARLWETADVLRCGVRSRAGRFVVSQTLDQLAGMMAEDEHALVAGRDPAYAFRSVEINKARVLLDEMSGHFRGISDPAAARAAETGEAQAFFMGSGATDGVVAEMLLASRLPLGDLKEIPESLTHQLRQLNAHYRQHDAGLTGMAAVTSLEEAVAALDQGEALIEYHLPYAVDDPAAGILVTFVSTTGALALNLPFLEKPGQQPHLSGRLRADGNQPVDTSKAGDWVVETRICIQRGEDVEALDGLRELYRILVEPLGEVGVDIGSFHTVFFIPHGFLHSVPFAALQGPDGRFLAEVTAPVQAPSASVWKLLRDRERVRSGPASGFLGFAAPHLGPEHEPLPGAADELTDVLGLLAPAVVGQARVGSEATRAALQRDLAGQSIVHFATHGELPDEDVMNGHRLFLTPEGPDNGEVTSQDLRTMAFDGTGLVVLGICDGGVYRFGPGDEPLGLVPALLAAGARNVLGPLWAVDDGQARALLTEFYSRLLTLGPAQALRQAALSRLRAGAEIRDWAGFVLTGAARTPPSGRTPPGASPCQHGA